MILLTGTPGTGKTTVAKILGERLNKNVIHLNDMVKGDVVIGVEDDSGTKIADLKRLSRVVKGLPEDSIIEGHLSHLLDVTGLVIVFRTHPRVLESRLGERNYKQEKVKENLQAEALDVCLVEAVDRFDEVYEVDTTDRTPEESAKAVEEVLKGEKDKYRPGGIDYSEEYF